MTCGNYLPIENILSFFHAIDRQIVWAVLDCDRDHTQVVRLMGGAAGGDAAWPDDDEIGHAAAS